MAQAILVMDDVTITVECNDGDLQQALDIQTKIARMLGTRAAQPAASVSAVAAGAGAPPDVMESNELFGAAFGYQDDIVDAAVADVDEAVRARAEALKAASYAVGNTRYAGAHTSHEERQLIQFIVSGKADTSVLSDRSRSIEEMQAYVRVDPQVRRVYVLQSDPMYSPRLFVQQDGRVRLSPLAATIAHYLRNT